MTGGADDTVRVWSGQSGRRIHTLTEQAGNAVAVAYSPDGEFVASASSDGTGRVWRTRDWGLNSVLTGHTNALTNVSFSADSEQVVTTGLDGTARVSDIKSSDELFVLAGHRNRVASAVFTGTVGSAIVTSSPDGTIKVWDAVFQPELRELAHLSAPVVTLDVDDHVTATTSDGQRHTLDLSTGDELSTEPAPRRKPRRVVGPDGRSATMRGRIVIVRHDGETLTLKGHRDRVTSVAFSPLGTFLATTSIDHVARIWSLATGELIRPLPAQHGRTRREVQPGRALARHGGTAREPLGRGRRGERPPAQGARGNGHRGRIRPLRAHDRDWRRRWHRAYLPVCDLQRGR